MFQSALPCGERLHLTYSSRNGLSFNPRSRVGSDKTCDSIKNKEGCFNPRSRVGSDAIGRYNDYDGVCFNPRSRVGSDIHFGVSVYVFSSFNPRSRVGSDYYRFEYQHQRMKFQSALPCGERQPSTWM